MSNKSNGWDGRVKRLKPPVSMSETVEKDDADGREVNASEDMLQKDGIDDEIDDAQAKLSEMFDNEMDSLGHVEKATGVDSEVDSAYCLDKEGMSHHAQCVDDEVNIALEASRDQLLVQQQEGVTEEEKDNSDNKQSVKDGQCDDAGAAVSTHGDMDCEENSHHSIPRPSNIVHLTIRDLDTNEEVSVFIFDACIIQSMILYTFSVCNQ